MVPLLLICIPVVSGLLTFLLRNGSTAKNTALIASIATLVVGLMSVFSKQALNYEADWLPVLGSSFSLHLDGMAKMLALLTTISLPVVFAAVYNNDYKNANVFYGLMLLTQAGLLGVFLASDCLLFYFFWELALIPVYFLSSIWGGEKRIAVTFKFFVYTFIGSLLMLVGILYLYNLTPDHSFAIKSFYALKLTATQQNLGFWLFFIAFAIKMPIFPLHTWQPDAYEQSPTAVTMILSGVMVKMGIYAVIRWVIPLFPLAVEKFGLVIILLSVVGMLYASFIAIKQDDIKRLIAYSSIGHIGLMCAAIFAMKSIGLQGVMIQMFNHGINVIGLWIVADVIEQHLGTRKFSDLGGLAQKAPSLAILLVVLAFANVALPLTNAFVGEFLMFNGLFQYNIWIAAVAGISIILAAVYTLNMVQKVFYGNTTEITVNATDIKGNVQLVLIILVFVIIGLGVYPQPMIALTKVAP
ncbi:NuoM family protein [Parasediminibacterium paludis]|uniref:NuoM family protein n=1 Tax=Parasediminibacterium paludis TaxID=908966 RepID=A0ABV8PUS9_9BACT